MVEKEWVDAWRSAEPKEILFVVEAAPPEGLVLWSGPPARRLAQRIEVFVALCMGILHRHSRTERDVFSDGFPKGLVVRQARRIEGGEIQLDEALPLDFGNVEISLDLDQMVNAAQFPGEAIRAAEGFSREGRHMVYMARLSCAEERLEQLVPEYTSIEDLLESVERAQTTSVFKERRHH
jgi:hypothetical protein